MVPSGLPGPDKQVGRVLWPIGTIRTVFRSGFKAQLGGCCALQGRNSAFKRGDDEAEVQEYLRNCRRTPMRHGGRTLSEPGIEIWTPSSDLAQSRRRES
jgi:hypothetical protein